MLKKLLIVFFSIVLVIVETSFFSHFTDSLVWLRLFLLGLLYFAFFIDYETSLFMAVAGGLVFDSFSYWPFGFMTLLFFIILLVVFFLTTHLVTNRSFYSWLSVVVSAVVLFYIFTFVIHYVLYVIKFQEWTVLFSDFLRSLLLSEIYNLIFAVFLFFVVHKKLERLFLFQSHG